MKKQYLTYYLYIVLTVVICFFPEFKSFATVYYVSNSGNDANKGVTTEQAWKTIARVNRFFFKPGDQILFKRGDTFEGTITVKYSGTSNSPITYGAWGEGAKPVISGFTTITGWTNEGDGIYSKTLTVESNPEIVTVNGVQYAMGRTPNSDRYNPQYSDYFHIDSYSGTTSITDSEVPAATANWTGAEIIIRSSNYWDWIRTTITGHSGTTLKFTNSNNDEISAGFGYFLQNDLRTLDQFGEWYYGSGKFYMYFGAANPTDYTVKISTKDKLIKVDIRDYITVKNLKFEGANNVAASTKSSASNAYNLTIDNCDFDFNYKAVYGHTAPNMTITNCNIQRSSDLAIYNHWNSDGAYIANNVIDSTGLVIGAFNGQLSSGSGVGIMLTYSKLTLSSNKSIIEYNKVLNTGYTGINFNGDSAIVRFNFIDTYGLNKSDGGGIYRASQDNHAGEVIDHNIVINGVINDDAVGLPQGTTVNAARSIYIDHLSRRGVRVTNNISANNESGGIFIHGSQNVVIENNTVYNCGNGVSFQQYSDNGVIRNIVMKNNIIVSLESEQLMIWTRSTTNDFSQYGTFTNNYYAKPDDDNNAFATLVNTWENTYRNFASWKSYTKLDNGSNFIPIKYKEGEREKLFYNNTIHDITFNLGKSTFKDIQGEQFVNSFVLKPFTSKILIGKNFEEINQKPEISDHSFHIKSPKYKNDSLGQILAFDPDTNQILYYSIYKGNEMNWFSVDSVSGKLFVQNDIGAINKFKVELDVIVKDNSINSLSDSAKILIYIEGTDTSPPEITSFSIPRYVFSHYVPVESFTVIDDVGIKGFLLSLTPEIPHVYESTWTDSIPEFYYSTQQGQVIIYAWAIDFADNISLPLSDTVSVFFPQTKATYSEYLFEEDIGPDVFDSNNLVNGTIIDFVGRGEGAVGNGLIFNGEGYVDLGKNYGENVLERITISAWIKPDHINSDLPVLTHGGFYSNTFELYIDADSSSILFNTYGTLNTTFIVKHIDQLWDGNWHHLLVRYNGSRKTIYFDGNIIAEIPDTGVINSGFWNNLYIGANISQNDSSFYHGVMDEVRIYNFALTEDEISDLYHSVNKVLKAINTSEDISICEGDNYLGWKETGSYKRILKRRDIAASGADSIITTNLIVQSKYNTPLEIAICEKDTFVFNNQKIYKSGTYSMILNSVSGCDSIVTLKLKVQPKYLVTEDISILSGTNYLGWETDGNYQRNLISANGCDSIVITNLSVVQFFTHSINLEKGWNIFSTYLVPPDSNFENIFKNLKNQNSLIAVQDENENSYLNEGDGWFNGIGEIKESEGYKIRVNSDSELKITGFPVNLPLNIQLNAGWNIISFPYQGKVNAMEVIQPLINDGILNKVQDERGNSIEFWGNKIGWINGIGNFNTGEGYLMEVTKDGVLTISKGYKKAGLVLNSESETNHFNRIFEGNGFGHMNINLTGLTDIQLEVGDEIAAFDGDKCVGSSKLSNLNITSDIASIQASISDKEIINGFTEGNKIDLLVWRSKKNEEFRPNLEVIGGSPIFKKYGSVFFIFDITNSSESKYNILEDLKIFPNPALDKINIVFQIEPKAGTLILLTDITGKQILLQKVQSNQEQLNIASQPSGIYLIKIISGETSVTKKIVKR